MLLSLSLLFLQLISISKDLHSTYRPSCIYDNIWQQYWLLSSICIMQKRAREIWHPVHSLTDYLSHMLVWINVQFYFRAESLSTHWICIQPTMKSNNREKHKNSLARADAQQNTFRPNYCSSIDSFRHAWISTRFAEGKRGTV